MGISKCCKKKRITAIVIETNSKNSENLIPNDIKLSDSNLESIIIKENENQNPNATLEDFSPLKVLGRGSFGKVVLVRLEKTKKLYAMKILKKELVIKRKQVNHTMTERSLLEKLNHPFIVKLFYAFQDKTKLYFITEFMQGGELFFHLRRNSQYKEKSVKFYMSEILLAIDYMHKNNFIYRDLKPENILIDKLGHIKLTDFGLSKLLDEEAQKTYTLCGTPEYLAPEIIFEKGYDKTCDWFSFGVLMFEMLCGFHPFKQKKGKFNPQIYKMKIIIPENIGKNARDLIEKLLISNPRERIGYNSSEEIMKHDFFKDIDFDKVLKKNYKPPFIPKLDNEEDLRYFDKGFTEENVESFPDKKLIVSTNGDGKSLSDEFKGFSYQPEQII
jgi:serine/threonine protein kinase